MSGRLIAARRGEHGMSLVETMVALALLAAVVPIIGPLMISAMRSGGELQMQSEVVDELRLQVAAVARELRSAECIYEPAENTAGARLRFLTSANGSSYEVTYEVVGGELLRTEGTSTRETGRGIVGTDQFEQIANPRRSVAIDLHVQLDTDHGAKRVQTAIAGRNAWRTC